MKNKNKNQKIGKTMKASVAAYDSVVLSVTKTTLKRSIDDKAKKRQLRYAKKILNDDLLLSI